MKSWFSKHNYERHFVIGCKACESLIKGIEVSIAMKTWGGRLFSCNAEVYEETFDFHGGGGKSQLTEPILI